MITLTINGNRLIRSKNPSGNSAIRVHSSQLGIEELYQDRRMNPSNNAANYTIIKNR